MKNWSTTYLLTCAAIGVAGGFVLVGANWLSTLLFSGLPFISVALAGLWLLPAVIALRLLERPFAGLLVGLISGLVIVPFSGYGFGSVATNLWWAFFAELPFLVVLYRFWTRWQHFSGALVVSIVYPVLAWASFDLGTFPFWGQVAFFALVLASTSAATAIGIAIADALKRAGVARLARHRSVPGARPAVATTKAQST
jgi:energy-coupling factor transport system substrate-specific component